jgi:hypothetical protein
MQAFIILILIILSNFADPLETIMFVVVVIVFILSFSLYFSCLFLFFLFSVYFSSFSFFHIFLFSFTCFLSFHAFFIFVFSSSDCTAESEYNECVLFVDCTHAGVSQLRSKTWAHKTSEGWCRGSVTGFGTPLGQNTGSSC